CWYAADGTRSSASRTRFRWGSLPPAPASNGDGLASRRSQSEPKLRHQWRWSSSLSHPSWRLSAATRVLRIDNHFLVMLGSRRTPVRRTTIPVAPAASSEQPGLLDSTGGDETPRHSCLAQLI